MEHSVVARKREWKEWRVFQDNEGWVKPVITRSTHAPMSCITYLGSNEHLTDEITGGVVVYKCNDAHSAASRWVTIEETKEKLFRSMGYFFVACLVGVVYLVAKNTASTLGCSSPDATFELTMGGIMLIGLPAVIAYAMGKDAGIDEGWDRADNYYEGKCMPPAATG